MPEMRREDVMDRRRLKVLRKCGECRRNPVVFIQYGHERIGVCRKHWRKMALSEKEW